MITAFASVAEDNTMRRDSRSTKYLMRAAKKLTAFRQAAWTLGNEFVLLGMVRNWRRVSLSVRAGATRSNYDYGVYVHAGSKVGGEG